MARLRRFILPLVRAVVLASSLLFLYSALAKATDFAAFRDVLGQHGLVPASIAHATAIGVVGAEGLVGLIGLIAFAAAGPGLVTAGLGLQALLWAAFSAYAAVRVVDPPPEPAGCGCGVLAAGIADWKAIFFRNSSVAAALCLLLAAMPLKRRAPEPACPAPAPA